MGVMCSRRLASQTNNKATHQTMHWGLGRTRCWCSMWTKDISACGQVAKQERQQC